MPVELTCGFVQLRVGDTGQTTWRDTGRRKGDTREYTPNAHRRTLRPNESQYYENPLDQKRTKDWRLVMCHIAVHEAKKNNKGDYDNYRLLAFPFSLASIRGIRAMTPTSLLPWAVGSLPRNLHVFHKWTWLGTATSSKPERPVHRSLTFSLISFTLFWD